MNMQLFMRLVRQYIAAEQQFRKSYRDQIAALIAMRIEYAQVNEDMTLSAAEAEIEPFILHEYPSLAPGEGPVPF